MAVFIKVETGVTYMTLEMINVSWVRDGEYILKNINWKVEPGEHWALVGLNGSGKTTLLNIINGYVWPTNGTVKVLGKEFGKTDIWDLRRSIGWVSSSLQERLYGHDEVLDIVLSGKFASIGLYENPESADREKAYALLDQIGCTALAGRSYKTLSQGEKQKVLIARAMMNNPKLLILDEPCSGLDIISREQFLAAIEKLCCRKMGPNLFYVTHRVEEIMPMFTRTLLLRRGEVHSRGETTSLLKSENLSNFFEIDVDVRWKDGRPWITVKRLS